MPADPTPTRRIYWTCIHEGCGHSFRSYTRKGEKITCPKCHRVQPGPAGVRAQLKRLEELELQVKGKPHGNGQASNGRAATEVKVVGTRATPAPAPVPPPASPAPAPPSPPATSEPGVFERVFFGGRARRG